MKRITILGSTGSIGTQTLDVVRQNPDISVIALAAGRNIRKLEEQVRAFHPRIVAVWNPEDAKRLRAQLSDVNVYVASGMEGLVEAATHMDVDIVVGAIVGMIGIVPTIEAIRAGKDIALANKETLVTAGHIIMPLAEEKKVRLLPVDSEHSAIFQCLNGENQKRIEKILLTCSGGPFRGYTAERLKNVTVEDALKNPNWSMGRKITIDSATLVNKGLEVIEACWLFGVKPKDVEVVVQPKSIIHSAVQFEDGAIIAQLGAPDMRLPIQYALTYPDRRPMETRRLDLFDIERITFEKPDTETFRGIPMAISAMEQGGSMPTIFNAANEMAVERFLERRISFLEIYEIIEDCMASVKMVEKPSLQEILEAEKAVSEHIRSRWDQTYPEA